MKCKDPLDSKQCYKRILRLCEVKERCSAQLQDRIVTCEGYALNTFRKALARAKTYGVVDDERYAEFFIRASILSNKGTWGILDHLDKNNIAFIENQTLCQLITEAKNSDLQRAIHVARKTKTRSKDPFRAIVSKLVRRGFSLNTAIKATKLILS